MLRTPGHYRDLLAREGVMSGNYVAIFELWGACYGLLRDRFWVLGFTTRQVGGGGGVLSNVNNGSMTDEDDVGC